MISSLLVLCIASSSASSFVRFALMATMCSNLFLWRRGQWLDSNQTPLIRQGHSQRPAHRMLRLDI